jgi:hypothetical protein
MPTEREKKLASDENEAKTSLKARMGKNPMRADVLRFVKYRREGNSIAEASRKVLTQRVEEYKSTKKYAKTHGIKGRRRPRRKTQKKVRNSYQPITTTNEKNQSITLPSSQNKTYNVTVKSSLPLSSVKNMSACELCEREKEYKKELEQLQEKYKNVLKMNQVMSKAPTPTPLSSTPSPNVPNRSINTIRPNTLAIINKGQNDVSSNTNETTPSLFRKNEPIINSMEELKSIGENITKPTIDEDQINTEPGENDIPTTNAFKNTQK